ncbi:ABC transporter ATP-binding protein [Halorarius halobius]|uniref:ABC transporter ATP-binding protein n=1 Tax=Halorarius halobius TaxID=2962671 RepID=UPI0020CC98FE|nr:ABC transporter ATP-binding protein [Halorarius halobius]
MTDPAIETEGLVKRYGEVTALDSLSLSVPSGELFGFLGPNGAGKSTTINVLTGQLVPDEGTARVAGVDPVEHPVEAREKVGILPENGRPPSFLTVREYFDFVAAARDLADVDDRVASWADRLAFESKLDTLCTDLSQGERQKVLITQAFLHEPEVVFIDEPLTNLDPIIQERAKRFFRTYADEGNTVFLSTHFIPVAQEMCSRVAIVNRGRMLDELDPRDIDEGTLLDRFFETVDDDTADVGSDPARPGVVETDGGGE